MGIFDERIQMKNRLEDEMFVEAFQKLVGVVAGQKPENALESERLLMLNVMEELGKNLNISIPYTSNIQTLNRQWSGIRSIISGRRA